MSNRYYHPKFNCAMSFSLPGGGSVLVEFKQRNGIGFFATDNEDIQAAIEADPLFVKGIITADEENVSPFKEIPFSGKPNKGEEDDDENDDDLTQGDQNPVNPENTDGQGDVNGPIDATDEAGTNQTTKVEFPEVTNFTEAKEFLSSDPYNISKRSIKNPASVLAFAESLNLSFPNFVVPE